MNLLATRTRLLSGAALTVGLTMIAASPAQATCTVAPAASPVTGTITCATTTTTDTTYAGVSPASDRNYNVDTAAGNVTATVSTGATVDGFGLAVTNTGAGGNALNVVNNGAVQINATNAATQGGTAALNVTALGATNVNYSGTGTITNLGTGGNGLNVAMTGTGNFVGTVGGNVTSAVGAGDPSGNAIAVINSGTAGNITLTTAAGTTLRGDNSGILVGALAGASTSNLSVTNNAAIGSLTGAPGTLDYGIINRSFGLGSVTTVNNGAIGSATDRIALTGIYSDITNAASTAAFSLTGSGAIFAAGTGIFAANAGTGTTTVNYTGAVNTTAASGVVVSGGTGATSVTLGAVTAATDAVTVNGPAVVDAVTVVCASPFAAVVAVPGLTVSPPPAKFTATPDSGLPAESFATTTRGLANVAPTTAD